MCKKTIIHLQRDQQKMILHWEILFAFFLIQPALLAPPPMLSPDSSLQFVESAKQEDFLINGMADNGPKVGRSRMYYFAQNIYELTISNILFMSFLPFQIRRKRFIFGDMLNIANLITVDVLGTNLRPTNFILFRVRVSIADS